MAIVPLKFIFENMEYENIRQNCTSFTVAYLNRNLILSVLCCEEVCKIKSERKNMGTDLRIPKRREFLAGRRIASF
jgi:hypothetical protein